MNNPLSAADFDAEAVGRAHAQELIIALALAYHTAETFSAGRDQARSALLELLDAVDPAQVVEAAWQNDRPDEIVRRLAGESALRTEERGSAQDPLFPPRRANDWD